MKHRLLIFPLILTMLTLSLRAQDTEEEFFRAQDTENTDSLYARNTENTAFRRVQNTENSVFSFDMLEDIFSQIAENSEDSEGDFDQAALYDDLLYFSQNPIDLNNTNREELGRLRFLSEMQIENLLYYMYKNKSMKTLYELQLVEGFFNQDIRNLLPFVTLGEVEKPKPRKLTFKDVFKWGKHEVLFRLDRGLETKEGYRFDPEDEESSPSSKLDNKKYLGDPFYTSLRYRFRYRDRIQFSLTAEKDAGEKFTFKGPKNYGYDFYSASLQLNNFSVFKTIVVGDYRASFGQGLILRQENTFGKSSMVMNVTPTTSGLKRYSSTDEHNFFRGAGTTISFWKFNITAFYSYRKLDADTTGGFFSRLNPDFGLHRTEREFSKKWNVTQHFVGGNVNFTHKNFSIGATAYHFWLDNTLIPTPSLYNVYYFSGKEQTAASLDYRLRWQRFFFFGETAMSDKLAFATINGIVVNPASGVAFTLVYRYFDRRYDVLFSNVGLAEGRQATNQEGLYFGAEVRPIKYWKFSAYADVYRYPWLKSGIDKPSIGFDYLFQADYAPARDLDMYVRFKYKRKERNLTLDPAPPIREIENFDKSSLRFNIAYRITPQLKLRNIVELNYANSVKKGHTWGFAVLQDLEYSFKKIPLSFNFRYAFIDTEDSDNAVYLYEKDILYAFSIPSFSDKKMRYYLNVKYDIPKWKLSFWLKFAQTYYFDTEAIGSSSTGKRDEIQGNTKSDIRFLVRWKF